MAEEMEDRWRRVEWDAVKGYEGERHGGEGGSLRRRVVKRWEGERY